MNEEIRSLKAEIVKGYEDHYLFSKDSAGVFAMIHHLSDLMAKGLSSSLQCTTISKHSTAFDFEKLAGFCMEDFVRRHSASFGTIVEDFLLHGINNLNTFERLKEVSLQSLTSDSSLFVLFYTTVLSKLSDLYTATTAGVGNSGQQHSSSGVHSVKARSSSPGVWLPVKPQNEELHSSNSVCRMQSLYYLLSNSFASSCSDYVSDMVLGAQVIIQLQTNSRAAAEFLSHVVPGGVSNSYILSHSRKAVKNIGELGEDTHCHTFNDIKITHDNNGFYHKKQCETPDPKNAARQLSVPVWTNATQITLTNRSSSFVFQTSATHSPLLWKNPRDCPADFFDFIGQVALKQISYKGQTVSHAAIQNQEGLQQAEAVWSNRSAILMSMRDVSNGTTSSNAFVTAAEKAADDGSSNITHSKICKMCKSRWTAGKGSSVCLCGSKEFLVASAHSSTSFAQHSAPRKLCNFSIVSRVDVKPTATSTQQHGEAAAYTKAVTSRNADFNATIIDGNHDTALLDKSKQEMTKSENRYVYTSFDESGNSYTSAIIEPLPPCLWNPGLTENAYKTVDR